MLLRQRRSSPARAPGLFARFRDDARANVAVIFALTLPILVGVTGLVAEYGHSLSVQANNQRTADLAAYAGALAYSSNSSSTLMVSAAKRVGELNGVVPANVAVSLVTSPRDSTKQAVRAVIAVDNPMFLAPILGVSNTVRVVSLSYAEVGGAGVGGCIVALDAAQTGVTLSGGTRLSAPLCAVSSNAKIEASCGTTISAKKVSYNTSLVEGCNNITAESKVKAATSDPLAGNAAVATARGRFATLGTQVSPSSPAAPVVTAPTGGFSIDFAYNDSSTQAQAVAAGCTAAKSGSTWTLTCPQGTNRVYNFANLTFGGGINFSFNPSGTAGTTYNFSGPLNLTATNIFGPGNYTFGGTVNAANYGSVTFGAGNFSFVQTLAIGGSMNATFGAGTFTFAKGLTTGGSSVTNFGAGTFRMGRSSTTCNGSTFGLCNAASGATTFAGPSTFQIHGGVSNSQTLKLGEGTVGNGYQFGASGEGDSLKLGGGSTTTLGAGTFEFSAGINNGGGGTVTLGTGSANVFKIGKSTSGDAFYGSGGSKTTFADASVFELGGNLNTAGSGGGSCLIIGAAAQHDIRGFFSAAGGMVLGAGIYTVNGYFAVGANGGGGTGCAGNSQSVKATGVTIVISGILTPTSGDCIGRAFCVTAGYNNFELTAPTSGTMSNLAVIGPASPITAGALFSGGGSGGKISGAFYFPNGPIALSGGAGVSGGTSCLTLIGSLVSLAGGTTAASECAGLGSGGSSRPRLVQ